VNGEREEREDAKEAAKKMLRRVVRMDVFEFRRRGDSGLDDRTEALAEAVIGAAIEVHRLLGPGMPETSYRNALAHELDLRKIPHQCEVPCPIVYKGKLVGKGRLDLLVDGVILVELKAVEALTPIHRAQVVTYLKVTKLKLGLLINFNVMVLKDGIKRIINTH
jgi:GxxExxY protein